MHTSCTTFDNIRRLGLILLLAMATHALAHDTLDEQFDDTEKPWQEITVLLPAPPLAENLLKFYVSPTATHVYAIDAKSVSVGSDDVVRYTLVAKSDGGAQNISYEGVRCQSKEMKSYAFGHQDGKWVRARRDQWQRIVGSGANRPQAALAQDYFCRVGIVAGSADEIVKKIRSGQAYRHQAE